MATKPPDFVTSLTACLPPPEVLQAIGELWVRLSQLEAWVDLTIGKLLRLDWPAQSELEVRIQRHGTSAPRDEIDRVLVEFDKIRIQRNIFAHGRFLLEVPGEIGQLVKSKMTKKTPSAYDHQDIEPSEIQVISNALKELADQLMWALQDEFVDLKLEDFYKPKHSAGAD